MIIRKELTMKVAIFFLLIILLSSCSQSDKNNKEIYKPGLGEIMNVVQLHHAKLWFAGINQNWKLADYEIGELKEMFTAAQTYCSSRPEVKDIPIIFPAIDSLNNSIKGKNIAAFKSGFTLLTKTCNACHQQNHFEFNVITVPAAPPVSNQDFTPHE
jgi:hypothetical protein